MLYRNVIPDGQKARHRQLDHIPSQTLPKTITSSTITQNLNCIRSGAEPNTAVSKSGIKNNQKPQKHKTTPLAPSSDVWGADEMAEFASD